MKKLLIALYFVMTAYLPVPAQSSSDTGRVPADSPDVQNRVPTAPPSGTVHARHDDPHITHDESRITVDKSLLADLKKLAGEIDAGMADQKGPCRAQLENYCRALARIDAKQRAGVVPQLIATDSAFLKDKTIKDCPNANGLLKKLDAPLRRSVKGARDTALVNAVLNIRSRASAIVEKLSQIKRDSLSKTPDTNGLTVTSPVKRVEPDTAHNKHIDPVKTASAVSWGTVAISAGILLLFSVITLLGVRMMLKGLAIGNLPNTSDRTDGIGLPPEPGGSVQPGNEGGMTPLAASSRRLVCEVLMAAGPRKDLSKKETDTSLGEDVCGLVTNTVETVAWVLDGTSDSDIRRNPENRREYFSCRLLAQSFARQLKPFFASPKEEGIEQVVRRTAAAVKEEWLMTLRSLPDAEQQSLHETIRSGMPPVCSTAILIARLSLDGQIWAYRCGDSKLLVYKEKGNGLAYVSNALEDKSQTDNTRLYFKIIENKEGELDIWYSDPQSEQITENEVRIVIGFSDGIGDRSVALMKQRYAQTPEKVREEIAYQLQGTGDDKALCILEIVEG